MKETAIKDMPMKDKIRYPREERRTRCLACGSPLPEEALLTLPGMPASAQDIPAKEELSEDRGISLSLFQCRKCGLVQFDCLPVAYYRDVIRAVGLSETMRNLRREDYRHMIETYGLSGKKFLECGCGRGEFMEVLKEFPAEVYATEADPKAAEAAAKLLGEGCHVMNLFPDRADLKIPGAPFDCFLSFNFLEHQPDPCSMLGAMYRNLREGGYGLITVPSFEYILERGRYYELIRDHIANYTLDSLIRLCRAQGFEILEQGRIGIGDTLRLVVRKPAAGQEREARERDTASRQEFFSGAPELCGAAPLLENYQELRQQIAAYTERLRQEGRRLALFGAGHQGFTIAATTALKDAALYMMDSAPFKQGRYAPASHIPIVSPDHFFRDPVDVVMITAPGYVKEITALIRERFKAYDDLVICSIEPETYR